MYVLECANLQKNSEINMLKIQGKFYSKCECTSVHTRNLLNSPSDKSLSPISPPQSSSIGTLSPSMQLICQVCNALWCSVLPSVFHFTLVPASFSLIVCHPCGLPAITPPVHQHMGQEGGMYADIWTHHRHGLPLPCRKRPAVRHTHRFQRYTPQPYGQEIRLTSQ